MGIARKIMNIKYSNKFSFYEVSLETVITFKHFVQNASEYLIFIPKEDYRVFSCSISNYSPMYGSCMFGQGHINAGKVFLPSQVPTY